MTIQLFVIGFNLEMMNTLHIILTQQDSKCMGGVGQEFRKHISANSSGGSWSKYQSKLVQSIGKYTEPMCFLYS